MLCCCCPKTTKAYIFVAFSIWVELGCGIVAATWTAFYTNHNTDVLPYVIFAFDLTFVLGLFCFTTNETWSRLRKNSIISPTLNWLFVLCTIVTFSLFLIIFYYNKHVLEQHGNKVVDRSFGVFMCTVYLLPLFYMISSTAPVFRELFPFIMFVIWIQMGTGLVLTTWTAFFKPVSMPNAWAYAIFSVDLAFATILFLYTGKETCIQTQRNIIKKPVVAYWVCGMSTVVTSALFGLIWAYHAFVLWEKDIPRMITNALGIYIYSIYLLTLLECIPDGDEEIAIRDDDEDAYGLARKPPDNYSTSEVVVLQYYTPALNTYRSTRTLSIDKIIYKV